MKRRPGEPCPSSAEKKRRVKYETYKKWVVEYDVDCQTMTWLDCETENEAGVKVVTSLKCRMCSKYRDKIIGRKNFSAKWITGADSVKTTNVHDHAKSDQHGHAMNLHRRDLARDKGLGASAYAPIAQALSTLPEGEHGHAMNLHRRDLARDKGLGASAYAPIAQALVQMEHRVISRPEA